MKPLCVLLHGYPNTPEVWKEQIPFLEKHFELLNLALPGSQTGALNPDDLKLKALVNLVAARVELQMNPEVILVGHDIGSFILSEVSCLLGKRVRAQVFLSGMDFRMFRRRLLSSAQGFKSWYVGLFQLPILPEFLVPKFQGTLSKFIYSGSTDLSQEAPFGFAPVAIYRELFSGIESASKRTEKSSTPTLFVFGDKDRFIGPPTESDIGNFFSDADLRVIPGGHWPQRENPGLVNGIIRDFLNRQDLIEVSA